MEISEAQRREINEMDWLITDIERNGIASTSEEAASRPVPDFEASAARDCQPDEQGRPRQPAVRLVLDAVPDGHGK